MHGSPWTAGAMQRPGGEIEEKTENLSAALQIKEPDITCILVKHLSIPYSVCDPWSEPIDKIVVTPYFVSR